MMLTRHSAGAFREQQRGKKQTQAMSNADASQTSIWRTVQGRPVRRPLLEMWLPADAHVVPEARHRAIAICREAGVSENDCYALAEALGEALANAVVHGAPDTDIASCDDAGQDICLCIWKYHDRLIIKVHDRGPGFDPPTPPYLMPLASAQDTHGRGLPLMEMLTDALVVCRGDAEEGGASIYLVKNLPEQPR